MFYGKWYVRMNGMAKGWEGIQPRQSTPSLVVYLGDLDVLGRRISQGEFAWPSFPACVGREVKILDSAVDLPPVSITIAVHCGTGV